MHILFWILVGAVLWTYVGYPCLLAVLALFRKRRLVNSPIEPTVTVVIAAYNEEKHIARKLENTLGLEYPGDKLRVIVASDCSIDRTHEIVEPYRGLGVKLVALPRRGGKTAAQNAAVAEAEGEILIFTDATTMLPVGAIRELV